MPVAEVEAVVLGNLEVGEVTGREVVGVVLMIAG